VDDEVVELENRRKAKRLKYLSFLTIAVSEEYIHTSRAPQVLPAERDTKGLRDTFTERARPEGNIADACLDMPRETTHGPELLDDCLWRSEMRIAIVTTEEPLEMVTKEREMSRAHAIRLIIHRILPTTHLVRERERGERPPGMARLVFCRCLDAESHEDLMCEFVSTRIVIREPHGVFGTYPQTLSNILGR
jgi:hypothetical protein